ncbi:glucose-1-phosphate thymidylyltransferase RfbA [Rickettsiales bacterium]|nr:glucose-1-phosphate thymidylyltransferase RfbA [Rickettsiales bacterium]MDB2550628.1 glucose-1-phosphate thymidylyltransferase RfbA [Rickettsiales bacterium]
MKGIILAGGSGTRLSPITNAISKQLLPVYDKPMIYYPLSNLMNIGIKDIMIISTSEDLPRIENLLGDGKDLGINLSYKIQPSPDGIAQAFILAEDFIGNDSVSLILGDNIFYGSEISGIEVDNNFKNAQNLTDGAYVIAYRVSDPERYGVVELDENKKAISIEEKPKNPKSDFAVTGWYFYDNKVVDIAKNIKPSARGELEITDVNNVYLKEKKLSVLRMNRGFAWLDAGTHDSLHKSAQFIEVVENRQAIKIGCIEETAFNRGYISKDDLQKLADKFKIGNSYGDYLRKIIKFSH